MQRQLFADTANLTDIINLHETGVISGVTTNPSIIAKEPKSEFNQLIKNLAAFCNQKALSFSVEVFTVEPEEIFKQGLELKNELGKYLKNQFLYIKVPIGLNEAKVIKKFADLGINVNCTACFTEEQLKLAALSGAKYVSLFFNRARDAGINVQKTLENTNNFIEQNKLDCKIIAGSIRSPSDVSEAWNHGAHIVTCSPTIIKNMFLHEGTDNSIKGFMKDFSEWLK